MGSTQLLNASAAAQAQPKTVARLAGMGSLQSIGHHHARQHVLVMVRIEGMQTLP